MTTRKTCDRCKYYEEPYTTARVHEGSCALTLDANEHRCHDAALDRCMGWDAESYSAGVYVGPKFGCIHWEKKV